MAHLSATIRAELASVASQLATPGKGILAADEWPAVLQNRFDKINVVADAENSRRYRQLLFTSEGFENYLSGVILWRDTLLAKADTGMTFPELLRSKNVLPGVNVDASDLGDVPLPGAEQGETTQGGLDTLEKRVQSYKAAGATFAKWRVVYTITDTLPSALSIEENSHTTARYASICQANGLVPIVEPDISMAGAHSIQRCAEVTELVLTSIYARLHDYNVFLEGTVLKPNLVTYGVGVASKPADAAQQVAAATLTVLRRCMPVAVPGVFFLSGGLSEEDATVFLNATNSQGGKKPWHVSFCFGRALQQSCLTAWQGKDENIKAAQTAFVARCKVNSEATRGVYSPSA